MPHSIPLAFQIPPHHGNRTKCDSTIRRKITGIVSMANTLKLMGFFEQDDAEF